jgi:glycyl-tRNA synthetase beta chain
MDVPEEALICSIRSHQKYFCMRDRAGKLAPHFLVASNMQTTDGGKQIIAGNERVLRARLADAKFFWDVDRRTKLEERIPALHKMTFHAKLGTVGDKVEHIQPLAKLIAGYIPHADAKLVERAALLCKADLVSGMVGEFPELQGIMGGYYAAQHHEHSAIAQAIREHYAPLGPSDACPTAPVSVAVSLADKLDTLVGMFAAGEKPTGSKDPFALRRAALGVIRLILENRIALPLRSVLEKSLKSFPKTVFVQEDTLGKSHKVKPDEVLDELMVFFEDRLKHSLKADNVRHDLITAVFAGGQEDDLLRAVFRVAALDNFLKTSDGVNLLAAYKRAVNIVAIEEKKDNKRYTGAPSEKHLQQIEEQQFFAALENVRPHIKQSLKEQQFENAMAHVAKLRQPIDQFFASVTVNTDNDDLRKNRLKLLAQMRELLDEIADFSKIVG